MKTLRHTISVFFLWLAHIIEPRFIQHLTKTAIADESQAQVLPDPFPQDAVSNEGVGIIYRPTTEELQKMHEDETTKQAKEAIAETLRNTPAPTL